MAYTTIKKPSDYFETTTYTGGATDVSSLSFQPDFVWAKKRDGVENHGLFDAVRGATETLNSNTTAAESTRSGSLTSFDSDGWSMGGSDGIISASGSTYVGWAWKANGSGSLNEVGSIDSTVSVNTTSGFSIVSYTGTGSAATVGHGLGVAPKMIITKVRSVSGNNWSVYHSSLGAGNVIWLNLTDASSSDSGFWNNTTPTSSVFSIGTQGDTNRSSETIIAYCFAEKQGYSKFGSYTGNGNADGNFIYTGFKPAFFLAKRITNGTESWVMFDNKRANPFNGVTGILIPNLTEAETTQGAGPSMDFLSNGIKFRNTDGTFNNSGIEFIYMAFAENPFVTSTAIPATAR